MPQELVLSRHKEWQCRIGMACGSVSGEPVDLDRTSLCHKAATSLPGSMQGTGAGSLPALLQVTEIVEGKGTAS